MAFTNINDPAGVKSLLEQLRTSQAWQETVQQAPAHPLERSETAESTLISSSNESERSQSSSSEAEVSPAGPSVTALLSQLESSTAWPAAAVSPPVPSVSVYKLARHIYTTNNATVPSSSASSPVITPSQPTERSSASRQDVWSYTFQQALPHLAQLFDDPNFVASFSQMKQQQAELERQLDKERRAIRAKHDEKVKVALAKAKIFGIIGLSQHEAYVMSDAYRKEIQKFDAERVLVAWDGLLTKQQAVLEDLRVPTMFVTSVKTDREKQQKVIQVLEGIAGSDNT